MYQSTRLVTLAQHIQSTSDHLQPREHVVHTVRFDLWVNPPCDRLDKRESGFVSPCLSLLLLVVVGASSSAGFLDSRGEYQNCCVISESNTSPLAPQSRCHPCGHLIRHIIPLASMKPRFEGLRTVSGLHRKFIFSRPLETHHSNVFPCSFNTTEPVPDIRSGQADLESARKTSSCNQLQGRLTGQIRCRPAGQPDVSYFETFISLSRFRSYVLREETFERYRSLITEAVSGEDYGRGDGIGVVTARGVQSLLPDSPDRSWASPRCAVLVFKASSWEHSQQTPNSWYGHWLAHCLLGTRR